MYVVFFSLSLSLSLFYIYIYTNRCVYIHVYIYIYYTQYVYCTQNLSKFNVSKWKFGTEAEHAYEGLAGDKQPRMESEKKHTKPAYAMKAATPRHLYNKHQPSTSRRAHSYIRRIHTSLLHAVVIPSVPTTPHIWVRLKIICHPFWNGQVAKLNNFVPSVPHV